MEETTVPQSYVGLLYADGAYDKTLEPGKHRLKQGLFDRVERSVVLVDMRERSLTLKGQEILTRDKVAIRVSLLVYYRVTDPVAAKHNVASYEERIYEDVQLAARRFLAGRDLEAILSDRNEISDAVRQAVREAAGGYGVEILRADVKDLVFPGNLREIMNQVLETERRNEAKLIQARKEIEAQQLKARADNEAERQRLEARREQLSIELAADREKREAALQAEVEEAKALAEHPGLLKLRELKALGEMARRGAHFTVGLQADGLVRILEREREDDD